MKCRCCGSGSLELVFDLGKQAWGNDFIPLSEGRSSREYPLELYFCHQCSMVQIGYTISKQKMFINHAYLSGTTKSLKTHFVIVAEEILQRVAFGPEDYILDVGGNDGTFLEHFLARGIKVLNVDSGILQAKLSNEKGVTCINKFFTRGSADEIIAQYGQAKVIHGSGIFFHLEDLHSVFRGVKNLLSPEGLLVAEFIYLVSMVENCAYDQIYHEHLLYYNLTSFQRLLDMFDLEIFDTHMKPIHGGSCIAYIGHKGAVRRTKALEEAVSRERAGGYDTINPYFIFRDRAQRSKDSLTRMIRNFKSQGLSVQALGAPVKGSTILNYCRLTHEDIDCAVEINPYKCGTYYPGTKIPVYDQYKTPAPDIYLLLSWNFKDEILKKMGQFLDKGGQVVVPIPDPYVIKN